MFRRVWKYNTSAEKTVNENRKNNRGEIRNIEIFSLVWTNRLVNNGAHKHNLETALLRYCVSNVGHCNSSVEQVSLKFLRKIHSRYRFLEFYSSRRLIINLGDFYAKFYVKYRRVGFSLFRWYFSRINFSSNSKEAIHFLRHCSPSPLSLRTFPFFELNALFIKWLQANIFFPG